MITSAPSGASVFLGQAGAAELDGGDLFGHVVVGVEDEFGGGGSRNAGAEGADDALVGAVDVGADGALLGVETADFDLAVGGEQGAFPVDGFHDVGPDEEPGGGVGEQGGGTHAAGIRGGPGGGGDEGAVANKFLQTGHAIDMHLQPGGLAGGALDPGVVEPVGGGDVAVFALDLEVEHGELAEDDVVWGELGGKDVARGVHEEAEVPGIDTEEGEACAPVFTDAAQHRAVAPDDGDELGVVGGFVEHVLPAAGLGVAVIELHAVGAVFERAACPGARDGGAVEAVALDVGVGAGGEQVGNVLAPGEAVADVAAGSRHVDLQDLAIGREVGVVEDVAVPVQDEEAGVLPEVGAFLPGELDLGLTLGPTLNQVDADDVPDVAL